MQPQWFLPNGSAIRTATSDVPADTTSDQLPNPTAPALVPPAPATQPPANHTPPASQPLISTGQTITRELATRAQTLLQRLSEVEEALTDQEWWLMGRAIPEARPLAELTSLLAVARGELETFLAETAGWPRPQQQGRTRKEEDDIFELMSDPMWMSGSREKAIALLRMCTLQLPAMARYARALQANAERFRLPAAALDPLGIAAERLVEAEEMLRQPPA